MGRAEQCRAQAAGYAQLALQLRDSDLRKFYQELARHWRGAAERLEQPIKLMYEYDAKKNQFVSVAK